jgi:hypothetical protein
MQAAIMAPRAIYIVDSNFFSFIKVAYYYAASPTAITGLAKVKVTINKKGGNLTGRLL